jgi:hypothetical protein
VSALKEGFRRRDRRAYIRDPYAAYDPDKRRVTVVNPNTDSYYTGPKR